MMRACVSPCAYRDCSHSLHCPSFTAPARRHRARGLHHGSPHALGRERSRLRLGAHGLSSSTQQAKSDTATVGAEPGLGASTAPASFSGHGPRWVCRSHEPQTRWRRNSMKCRSRTCGPETSSGGPDTSEFTRGMAGWSTRWIRRTASSGVQRPTRVVRSDLRTAGSRADERFQRSSIRRRAAA
jgi:hypothetical protein